MAKKYDFDDSDGVWRTIGGRRVFIKDGQSLSDAMKESGKFKKKKNLSEDEKAELMNETMDKREAIIKKLDKDTEELSDYDRYNLAVSKLEQSEDMQPTERQYWAGIRDRYVSNEKAREKSIEANKPAGQKTADLIKESGVKTFADEIGDDNKSIKQLNNEMLGDTYKGKGETPDLVYSNGRRIDIANNENGGKTATIWKDGKIERKTNLPENVSGDKTKDYFDKYLKELDNSNAKSTNETMNNAIREKAYKKYLKEHPNSKMSFEDFKDMRKQ